MSDDDANNNVFVKREEKTKLIQNPLASDNPTNGIPTQIHQEIEAPVRKKKDSIFQWKKIKKVIGHLGLLIGLSLYTAAGGFVSQYLYFTRKDHQRLSPSKISQIFIIFKKSKSL